MTLSIESFHWSVTKIIYVISITPNIQEKYSQQYRKIVTFHISVSYIFGYITFDYNCKFIYTDIIISFTGCYYCFLYTTSSGNIFCFVFYFTITFIIIFPIVFV